MNIYMDENVPQKVASRVREEGYVQECGRSDNFLQAPRFAARKPIKKVFA